MKVALEPGCDAESSDVKPGRVVYFLASLRLLMLPHTLSRPINPPALLLRAITVF